MRVFADLHTMDKDVGNIPNNFYVKNHISYGKILPYSKAIIATGHTTTVLGGIMYGIPLLLLANGSATDDISEKCEKAGIALCWYDFERGVDPAFIEQSIDELINNTDYRQNVETLRVKFNSRGGSQYAAKLIEQELKPFLD